jgi:uncharacterized protein (DUF427 family)
VEIVPTTQAARERAGHAYVPDHRSEWEASPRWVRVKFGGQFVADSKNVMLLRETAHLPVYYFPQADVQMDLLVPGGPDHTSALGEATRYTVQAGGQTAADAAWSIVKPAPGAPDLRGYLAFEWHKMEAWFEEDDEVYVHPRDPYKRIDVLHSSRHVQVVIGGQTIADTRRPRLLFETSLPTRYYIPKQDVRMDLLAPSASHSRCPYKGQASYYSVKVGDKLYPDLAWYYPYPIPECPKIENLICFYNEKVDSILVDGKAEEKPVTPWS